MAIEIEDFGKGDMGLGQIGLEQIPAQQKKVMTPEQKAAFVTIKAKIQDISEALTSNPKTALASGIIDPTDMATGH